MKNYATNKVFRYSVYALISIVFISIYSAATSPLTNYYCADSAFFTMVGRGMKEGLLPYRDFFDMKGPYMFLFEYLGQLLLEGRTGIYVMQCINLTACLCVVDSIYMSELKLFSVERFKGFIQLLCVGVVPILVIAAFSFERGNLTEEVSLLFLLLSLKFLLTYFSKSKNEGQHSHPLHYGFFYGVFFGILVLIRITNAYLIGAILVTVSVELIYHKKIKNLVYNGLVFIGGVCAAVLPMALYFYFKGLLQQMLYQVFVFGFVYSSEVSFLQKIINTCVQQWTVVLAMLFPVLVTVFMKKDRKYIVFSITSFLFLLIAVSLGNGYLHYFTLGLPTVVFGLFLLLQKNDDSQICVKKKRVFVTALVILLLLQLPNFVYASGACAYRILDLGNDETYSQVQEIKGRIPQEDLKDVYVYVDKSCSAWYEMAKIFPPNKYCDWQDHYMSLSPEIKSELIAYFEKDGPKWLVTSSDEPIETNEMNVIIHNDYVLYAENDMYKLYQRKVD